MKSKEPGAIRQLFMFVGSSKGKMKFSILMAVLGELFGMVPFLILAMLADSLYSGTATTKDTVILAGIAALCQCIKTFLTWRSVSYTHLFYPTCHASPPQNPNLYFFWRKIIHKAMP